jgi:hypothetical protein
MKFKLGHYPPELFIDSPGSRRDNPFPRLNSAEENPMLIRSVSLFCLAVLATPVMAKTVAVGNCQPFLQSYPTVTQAIESVPADSTIMVCPGDYPEQIVIRQPLTLKGVKNGNAANPRITVPSGGLSKAIGLENGVVMFFQILVEDTDTGQVHISDIAVDGGGAGSTLGIVDWFSGVCFHNASGTLARVATAHQSGNGYGFGIFIDEYGSSMKTISIRRSTVRDFDADGIRSNASAATLNADIRNNSVTLGTPPTAYASGAAISIDGIGNITGNSLVDRARSPIGIGIGAVSKTNIVGNTIEGFVIGLWPLGDSNVIKGNKVVATDVGIVISGSANLVEQNSFMNIPDSAVSFNCTGTGNSVIHNLINDAGFGVGAFSGSNTITPNTYSNVHTIVGPSCS